MTDFINCSEPKWKFDVWSVQEDEGAKQAVDADTAVLQAKTGHEVKKKKEWYI